MKLKSAILALAILLSACAPAAAPALAPSATATAQPPTGAPTDTPPPTNTPTPTPIPYSALSPAEKLEHSRALVEKANNFSGEVFVRAIDLDGSNSYNFYWSPTAVDKDESKFAGSWKYEGSAFELDRTGETLPPLVMPGYENPDGSLVVVDPITGQETVYANPNIPWLGGEISFRDLYSLPQSKLAQMWIDAVAGSPEANADTKERATIIPDYVLYLPVLNYGSQTSVYASDAGIRYDVSRTVNHTAYSSETNNSLAPIYSPETGDFMFFINVMGGLALSCLQVTYQPDGTTNFSVINFGNKSESFGHDGQDPFGVIISARHPATAHMLGGGGVLIENSDQVGGVSTIEQILNADSEAEILETLNEIRLLVAYVNYVYVPAR